MNKKELREDIKTKLINLDSNTREEISNKLAEHLLQSDLWKNASTVGITVSGGIEWDTEPIIRQGWKEGKRMVVPKSIHKTRELHFYQLEDYDQLEVVYYNLREPNPEVTERVDKQEIDLLIVPGLVYDKRGYRVGFGGGYYDRFLADFTNKTVSMFYSKQLVDELPDESFDIPVQTLLTENGFISK